MFKRNIGRWDIRRSSDGVVYFQNWGLPEDLAVVGDYDRDNRDDIAIYRPSDGIWWITKSTDGTYYAVKWGTGDDRPLSWEDQP